MAQLEIYWSFRSPYSYMAVDRLCAIQRDFEVDIDFRPVRPLAMREPDFFERGRKQFVPYLLRDVPREAERLGIPFALPNPDPIDMDLESGKVASAQPIMDMVMGLAVAAGELGRGLDFAHCISHLIWRGVPSWNEKTTLSAKLAEADFDYDALAAWAAENAAKVAETFEQNERAQLVHHWGVPLMVLDGEPFFGQDRLDSLVWRLVKSGLRRD